MAKPTLHGMVDLEDALDSEDDMLITLTLWDSQKHFLEYLSSSRDLIAKMVAQHMNATRPPICQVLDPDEWMLGSFNVCIPVKVSHGPFRRVIIRFPLPHKIGDINFPGNADEKLSTEAATYAWLNIQCPSVPIPRLFGYALSNGQRRTLLDNMPFAVQLYEAVRRQFIRWIGRPLPCRYVVHGRSILKTGYLLMEDVAKSGTALLSDSWEKDRDDPQKRQNLLRDLARVILEIGRVRLPRIGSLIIEEGGLIGLSNRPLTVLLQQLENEDIDTGIERMNTYTDTVSYALDLVELHSRYLRYQPNAVRNRGDGQLQMATFACMRMVLPHFFPKRTRNGPFILRLTDIHQSNLFVDKDWHITSIIDLEYAAFLPQEMDMTPFWLNNQDLDGLQEDPEAFDPFHEEFNHTFREQERDQSNQLCPRADAMQTAWQTQAFFYYHALEIRTGPVNLFQHKILPRFQPGSEFDPDFVRYIATFWSTDAEQVPTQKIDDHIKHDHALRDIFSTQT